jgi:hypothetical protein
VLSPFTVRPSLRPSGSGGSGSLPIIRRVDGKRHLLAIAYVLIVLGWTASARADITIQPTSVRHGKVVFDLQPVRSYRFARAVLLPGHHHLGKRRIAAAARRGRLTVGRGLFPRHRARRRYGLRLEVTRSSRLEWGPPRLGEPFTVSAATAPRKGDNAHQLDLSPARDYVVRMPPAGLQGGLTIRGGRNVILIGGEIDVPMQPGASPSPESRRGLYLTGQTGTVHVEGLLIRGDDLSEGIDLSEPLGAAVQIENVRVEGVHARDETHFTDNHPDVLQTWAGPAVLRVDRLTGSTDYQGFFLAPSQYGTPPPLSFALHRIDLRPISLTARCSCYLLWQDSSFPLQAKDVWLIPHPPMSVLHSLWPTSAAWPGVSGGVPPLGEFVPAGLAGLHYQSPGYR